MKVEIYGKPYDQTCQNAVGLLKSANVNVKFYNTDREYVRNSLIKTTKELQKESNYTFKSIKGGSVPIVISPDTEEVLVGYSTEEDFYDNILKKASMERMKNFVQKYPEWEVKK